MKLKSNRPFKGIKNMSDLDQPLTLRAFIRFYEDRMEPRFQDIEDGFAKSEQENKTKFDFLYKSYEDLKQEHAIICQQIKRTDEKIEGFEARIGKVASKYAFGETQLKNPTQELADIKFRMEVAAALFEEFTVRLDQLEKNQWNEEERKYLAGDLQVLEDMVQVLKKRLDALEERS
jgi:chromosome segregation ATPase